MKAKFGILISVIAILAAAYTGVWLHKTNELKDRVANALTKKLSENNSSFKLTYDKIERAGYPFYAELAFTNPKFIEDKTQSQIVHIGNVTVGQSLFNRDNIWIKTSGQTDFMISAVPANKERAEDQLPGHIICSGSTFFECVGCDDDNQLATSILHGDFLPFEVWFPMLLRDLKLKFMDFTVTYVGENRANDQQIVKVKNAEFGIQNKIEYGKNNFSLNITVEEMGLIANPQSLDDLSKVFPNTSKEELRKVAFASKNSNFRFKAHGFIPDLANPFFKVPSFDAVPSFSIVIDNTDFRNEFCSYEGEGEITFDNLADRTFKGVVSFAQESKMTEKFYSQLVEIGEIFVCECQAVKTGDLDFSDLTKVFIEHSMDLNFYGQWGMNPNVIEHLVVELNKYKLSTDLYGLGLDGKLKKKNMGDYIGNLNIQLKNYKELFSDILNYYTKSQTFLAEAKAEKQLPNISIKFVEKIEKFLELFSTSSSSGQLDIPIVYEDANNIKVGSKTIVEVINAWAQLVADLTVEYQKSNS